VQTTVLVQILDVKPPGLGLFEHHLLQAPQLFGGQPIFDDRLA
jgi:hypothetical protein